MNSNPLNSLTAISPVDGRYRNTTEKLADYFSEQALIRYRIRVEVEYFIALCELPLPQLADIDRTKFAALRALYLDFAPADAGRVKEIESVTNHDVKAIEYIIKEKMDSLGLGAYKEFVHFGLTSQDINNTAIPLSLKDAMTGVYYPAVEEVRDKLAAFADEWRDVPMLARTHGQPASPTTLGKEFMVFVERVEKQLAMLHDIAKTYSVLHGGSHAQLGASWVVAETRNHALAQGVLLHVHWPWAVPEQEPERLFSIPFFVIYADKRVKHDQCVPLRQRYEDLLVRYGHTEKARKGIRLSWQQGECIERAFEAHLGYAIHEDSFDSGRLVQRA